MRGLTARLAASLDRSEIFEEIVRAAADLFAAQGAALLLTVQDTGMLCVEAAQGLAGAIGEGLPLAATVAARSLEMRAAIAISDTSAESSTAVPPLFGGMRPGALIVAPIRVEGKPFGVVEVYYAEPRAIPPDDVELLDALSDAAAIALRNATAYARILEQGAELARRNDELARQKEELARLNDELRRADVLKSQFLSTMSHELRTPLTSIIGFSSVLLRGRRGETLSDRQRDNAGRILSSARHLVTLINGILDLSRIEAGRLDVFRRDVDVREVLETLRAELEPQARDKGLTLRVEAPPDLAHVNTDVDRLRQVLINLAGNAIKFTHQGGVILRAECVGDALFIAVEDTGIGIADEEQEHIFGEFYQSDQSNTRAAGGTGLGLAISRRLVNLLGGRLTLRSARGAGSTFTVVLPALTMAHVAPSPLAAGAAAAARDGNRVLLIDDDPEMVVLLERGLEGSHWTVIGALSADEGLEKARALQPDAILLDVMMPETDGWRTLHRLTSDPDLSRIPVIMHTIVADQALGFSLGATDYLVKPVERRHLLGALNRLAPIDTGPVLIVDDDANIRRLLSTILSDEGIPVAVAASGVEALDLILERSPRLVILDLMMPGLDGFEVLRRLRSDARTRHISVIVVTAKTLTREEERMLNREASMVVAKDAVPLERLLDEVRGALEASS